MGATEKGFQEGCVLKHNGVWGAFWGRFMTRNVKRIYYKQLGSDTAELDTGGTCIVEAVRSMEGVVPIMADRLHSRVGVVHSRVDVAPGIIRVMPSIVGG